MDVSGSMDEAKDLPSAFHPAVPVLATRHYDKIELVFIRHHTRRHGGGRRRLLPLARDRRHGGVVGAGADTRDHPQRYPPSEWNIYARRPRRRQLGQTIRPTAASLLDKILPGAAGAHLRLRRNHRGARQNLWYEYPGADGRPQFAMQKIRKRRRISTRCSATCSNVSSTKTIRTRLNRQAQRPARRSARRHPSLHRLGMDFRADRTATRAIRIVPAERLAGHLPEPAGNHHRRADDGRLRRSACR